MGADDANVAGESSAPVASSTEAGEQSPRHLSNSDIFGNNKPNGATPQFMWPPPPPPDFQKPPPWLVMINQATETCMFKAALSGTAGGVMGLLFGLFFGGYSQAVDKAVEMEGPAALKLRVGMREAAKAMGSYAKSFAMFGVVFSGAECTVEKVRAKHDIWNSIIGGCVTGAVMSSQPRQSIPHRARASQMAVGCGGMAAFSAAIDYYMEYME